MQFLLFALSALVALAAASPLERRATCTPPATTTTVVNGATTTLAGPFRITASASSTAYPSLNGSPAHFGSDTYGNVVFGHQAGDSFFLQPSTGHLLSVAPNGVLSPAYSYLYLGKTPHVAIKASAGSNPLITCSVATSCALNCSVNGGSLQYLASVKDQPDWAIAANHQSCGLGCISFQPYIVN